ncbi:hypothetical protein PVAG01_07223 [Phlyctema vagabunda]|uniref:F-box domain-containing protein n=1 Tax=Phlyctema vagabunda TaxID=108571 RepID=A0ABR4PBT8_9HELO
MPSLLSLPRELQTKIFEYLIPRNQTFEFLLSKTGDDNKLGADRGYGVCGYPAFNTSILSVHPIINEQCNDLLYSKNTFQLTIAEERLEPALIITDQILQRIRRYKFLLILYNYSSHELDAGGLNVYYSSQMRDIVLHIVGVLGGGKPLRSLAFQLLMTPNRIGGQTRRRFEPEIYSILQHVLDPFIKLRSDSLSFGQSRLKQDYKTYLRAKILVDVPSREGADAVSKAIAKYECQSETDFNKFWNYPSEDSSEAGFTYFWNPPPEDILEAAESLSGESVRSGPVYTLAYSTTHKVGDHALNLELWNLRRS